MEDCGFVGPMSPFDGKLNRPVFTEGKGVWLYDINGKKYLDGISAIWNVSFGYDNELIIEKIEKQVKKLPFTNLYASPTDISVIYATRLINLLNGDFSRLIYTCSGSESVELAMKICRKYQNLRGNTRKKIGVLDYSYHGTTYGAMSLSGIDQELIDAYLPIVRGVEWIPIPCTDLNNETRWNEVFEKFVEINKEELAGIIVEPIIGSGGVIEIPSISMQKLEELCRKNDILFVVDEVATGFGRTGKLFAYQYSNVHPDLMCVSKGINSGYLPLGAVLLNDTVKDLFVHETAYIEHFSTQNGNPIACSAADAVLDLFTQNSDLLEQINEKGLYLYKGLLHNIKLSNAMVSIRYKGMMLAIDLKQNNGELIQEDALQNCINKLYRKGILVYIYYNEFKNSGIMLLPSYIISYREMDLLIEKLAHVLNSCIR